MVRTAYIRDSKILILGKNNGYLLLKQCWLKSLYNIRQMSDVDQLHMKIVECGQYATSDIVI